MTRARWRPAGIVLLVAVVVLGPTEAVLQYLQYVSPVNADVGAVSAFVRDHAVALGLVQFAAFVLGVGVAAIAAVALAFPAVRKYGGAGLGFVAMACVGHGVAARLGAERWRQAIVECVTRSQPLVEALQRYESERASAAPTLEALVPTYLARIPSTGLVGYPSYEYIAGSKARESYGNPWILRLRVPVGAAAWDFLVYYPDQRYGDHVGGYPVTQRVGGWALVHGS